ncbi:hypothetical protein EYM_02850 [Ignicoccus islandicus DSM 13165]|uniref:2-keto-4-pentenoate hydratase n=1 Tax=Ignicoccus islandicus DSM 13165 TaxID=940295 RepID=A0A0U3E388_9CREN|nr:hypothetical protein [Ignicoccus islandicus]ALU12363.1 hypothetical protein EYM_02850 [Ignicoccus islandicus DSM 13165]
MSSENTCNAQAWLKALSEKGWKCSPKDENEAYEVQRNVIEVAKSVWGEVIGMKIGLTSEESRAKFGGGPIFGPIFEKGVLGNGSSINLSKLSDPILEPEIFYCNGSYFISFEVPDNRYGKKWDELNYLEIIADIAGSYRVVVGDELQSFEGEVVLEGPNLLLKGKINSDKLRRNEELLKSKAPDGCLLLGTILPIVKVSEGHYSLECCGSKVEIDFI